MFLNIVEGLKYEYELILCKPNKEQIAFVSYEDLVFKPMFLEYNELNFSIRPYITVDGRSIENFLWGKILSDYIVLFNIKTGDKIVYSEYFIVQSPSLTYDNADSLALKCYSYEKIFLTDKTLSGFKNSVKRLYDPSNSIDDDGLPKGILNYVFSNKFNSCWTLKHIDNSVLERERILSFSGNNIKYVFDSLAESFNCVFVFDNVNMTVSIYERTIGMLGDNNGLILADDNYITRITYQEDTAGIKTRIYVFGKNQANISRYNPTGQLYVDDFSFYKNLQYMTQDLIDALTKFENLLESKKGVFTDYVDRLDRGDESVLASIESLRNELSWGNNFTTEQIKELTPFIKEDTATINTISDGNELYEYALRHLKATAFVPIQITTDIIDIFELPEAQLDWLKVKIGDFVNIYRKEFNLIYKEMRLISYEHNPINNSLRLEFSNKDELVTMQWINNMFFKSLENLQNDFEFNEDLFTALPDFEIPEVKQIIENVITNVSGDTIVNVVEHQVIVADTAMLLNAWIRYLMLEMLETNFGALDTRLPGASERNFIRVKDQRMDFINSNLSSETENYVTPYGDQIYWTAVGSHEQAYKYFTITDPISVNPDRASLSSSEQEEIRERHRVKIRKTTSSNPRLSIAFDESHEHKIPKMFWGTGDESVNGRGFIYKDTDGMYITYTIRGELGSLASGTEIGIRFVDEGTQFLDKRDGNWKDIGTGGSGDFVILDHVPVLGEDNTFEDDTLIFVYDPSDSGESEAGEESELEGEINL